jgi:hypothetical protein
MSIKKSMISFNPLPINEDSIMKLSMKLFFVQDSDRPMYVIAQDWKDAVHHWKQFVQQENDIIKLEDVEDPMGVEFLADQEDIIIKI